MKIYLNGKRDKKLERDYVGRFTSFKKRVTNFFRKVLVLSLIALAFYGTFKAGQYITPQEIFYQKVEAQDTLQAKIEELKNEVVETIKLCESGNKDLIYTFDPDPRQPNKQVASFGNFQYKLKTIVDYTQLLYGQTITERQALDIALDDIKATQLTKDIVFKDKGKGVNNWFHCSQKYNLKAKVEIIKELE